MKFSVLMSVYKKENPQFLREAIDSVLNQSMIPTEVVIMEDGPLTKVLYSVLDAFSAKYPNIIKRHALEENMGLGLALRRGVELCEYEWIARMDTDDISVPERFERQVSYIQAHPDVTLLGSNIEEYGEDMKTSTGARMVPESHKDILKRMKSRNPINHVTVMYRKSYILQVDSYQDCPYFEDYYLWCKLAMESATFYNIQENLVLVRAGDDMLKRRGGLGYIRHIIYFQKKIYRLEVISLYEMIANITVRTIASIVPGGVRASLYSNLLRRKA